MMARSRILLPINTTNGAKIDFFASITALIKTVNRLQREVNGGNRPETLLETIRLIRDEAFDLKKRESARVLEDQLLNTLMENIPDSIYFKDAQSRFVRVNKAWAGRRSLSSPDEAIGKTDFDFFPKELAQSFYDDEQKIIKTGKPLIARVEQLRLPGKPIRWISITKVPIRDPATHAVIGTCGDGRAHV